MEQRVAVSREEQEAEVLTPAEAGALLRVRPRQLQRMGVPVLNWGHKTKRYVKRDVLAWLDAQRKAARRSVAAGVDVGQ